MRGLRVSFELLNKGHTGYFLIGVKRGLPYNTLVVVGLYVTGRRRLVSTVGAALDSLDACAHYRRRAPDVKRTREGTAGA